MAERITVVTENRNLRTLPFVATEDHLTTGSQWEEWLEGIEREFRYFRITDPEDKKDAMIIYGGKEIARLEKSIPDPRDRHLDVYEKMKRKLNEYFAPKKNKHYSRYVFLKMRPINGESTVSYAARLREKAADCEFENQDDRILEHIIQTTDNQSLIKKTINKKWTLDEMLQEVHQLEDTTLQIHDMKEMKNTGEIAKVTNGRVVQQKYSQNTRMQQKSKYTGKTLCKYCGKTHSFDRRENCGAYGKQCNKCNKWNHFAAVCRSRGHETKHKNRDFRKKQNSKKKYGRDVRKTTEESSEEDSSDDEFFGNAIKHIETVKRVSVNKIGDNAKTVQVLMNDVPVKIEPDSGADVNIMDEYQYRAYKHRTQGNTELLTSKTKLSTLQNSLPVKGEFVTTVRNATRGVKTKIVVIKGKINSPPLIGKKTLIDLGMLQIKKDGSLKEPNDLRIKDDQIKSVKENYKEIEEITNRYKEVFEGIGLIADPRKNDNFMVKFSMKPETVPVAQKPRPVPYYLQEPLKKWIDQGLEEDIFEKVQPGEPVTWCSPLVVQPKPKFSKVPKEKLESHMIRASVDLRVPNKYMERNRILQSPVVEDFTYNFHDCKVFSKMDLRQGYHQLILHPDSRQVATFSTPWGNVRPKRLIFGAKSSQDLFDEAMYRIFGDIPKCLNQRDDILIGGKTIEEHNKTLELVLQRAKEFGVTFNKEKCKFGVEELEFYGYRFTKEGLKPTEDKVKAVKDCDAPESKEAVRSFLGMIGYLSKFIPRYAVLTAPLRELTKKDTKFKWGPVQNKAFQKLKDSITDENTIAFFDPKRPIIVRTEASYYEGLSAGLFQRTAKGLQPVHFISRSMSDTEKKYSQTEKDALAVKWAKTRFSMYLLGAPRFKIITSHKPLIPMFNNSKAKLPPRIEKWVMEMQDVDYELIYEPGKDEQDPLDYLSRHPLQEYENDETEQVVKMIVKAEHAIILCNIQKETAKDAQLNDVMERMRRNDWETHKSRPEISPFYMIRNDLYTAEGVLFRINQIVIPQALQTKVIKAAHSMGHLGITKTKQMLRAKYWFPALNSMVEETLGKCYECKVTTKEHREETIKPSKIPETAWHTLSVDYGGPYPDGHYNLVIIDKRTRYPVVEQTKSTSSKITVEKLRGIFSTLGVPNRLETDNGTSFTSEEFSEFATEMGFEHHKITPEHPRANGEAENFMKLLNKTEQIAQINGLRSYHAIQEMLMGYRSTPHPATGFSPYQALMNRPVRTKLDHTDKDKRTEDFEEEINRNDNEYKEKWKKHSHGKRYSEHSFKVNDQVLLKQQKKNKWSTAYELEPYIIYEIKGSSIGAKRNSDGRKIFRDASHFKLANNIDIPRKEEEWRGRLLSRTRNSTQEPTRKERQQMREQPYRNRQKPLRYRDNSV